MKNIEGCQGVSATEHMGDCSLRVTFTGTPEQQAHLTETVFRSGLGVLAMNEKGANLESLYMELTEGDEVK